MTTPSFSELVNRIERKDQTATDIQQQDTGLQQTLQVILKKRKQAIARSKAIREFNLPAGN